MKVIPVKTTFLEMFSRPKEVIAPPRERTEVVWERKPPIAFYRTLYDSVGRDWQWLERKRLTDDELSVTIHDDRVEIHVLYVDGEPAGFGELDRRIENRVQLMYFGLAARFFGQGLGKYFLNWVVHKAWSSEPERVWLHTCSLDHQAALPNYLKAGFVVFDEQTTDHEIVS